MNFNKKALGRRIRIAREKQRLTQQKLAELIDCSPEHISCCENGKKVMSLEKLVHTANVLEITPDELLRDSLKNKERVSAREMATLLSGCSEYEQRILLSTVSEMKEVLRSAASHFRE